MCLNSQPRSSTELTFAGDYIISPSTITLSGSTTNSSIDVVIVDNDIYEDNRNFTVELRLVSNNTGVMLENSLLQVTILDNDGQLIACR